jgi:hypothetical protein
MRMPFPVEPSSNVDTKPICRRPALPGVVGETPWSVIDDEGRRRDVEKVLRLSMTASTIAMADERTSLPRVVDVVDERLASLGISKVGVHAPVIT